MTQCAFTVCLVVLLSVSNASAQSDGATRLRQEKIRDAAVRSVEQSLDGLTSEKLPVGRLTSLMLEDGQAHRLRIDSDRLLRQVEERTLRAAVKVQLERFARGQTELSVGWVDSVLSAETRRIDAAIQGVLRPDWATRFEQARKAAVGTQRATLARVLGPTAADVETVAGADVTSYRPDTLDELVRSRGGTVTARALAQALKGNDVFEENRAHLEQEAAALLQRGLQDLWSQLTYVAQHDGAGALERGAIESLMAEGVRRMSGNAAVFPSVRTAIAKRAPEVERSLFLTYVGERLTPVAGKCDVVHANLMAHLSNGRALPPTLKAHLEALLRTLAPTVQIDLVVSYLARVNDGAAKPGLARRLSSEAAPPASLLSRGVDACIRATVTSLRQQEAERELAATVPLVASLALELNDSTLTLLHEGRQPSVESMQGSATPLRLEETVELRGRRLGELLAEGKRVVDTQVALVHDAGRQERFRSEIRSDRSGSEKEWLARYTSDVRDAWRAGSDRTLVQRDGHTLHSGKYGQLSQIARDRIAEVITFEFRKKEIPVPPIPATTGADGEGGGGGGGSGSGLGPGSGGGGGGGGGGACEAVVAGEKDTRKAQDDAVRWPQLALLALAFLGGGAAGASVRRLGVKRSGVGESAL